MQKPPKKETGPSTLSSMDHGHGEGLTSGRGKLYQLGDSGLTSTLVPAYAICVALGWEVVNRTGQGVVQDYISSGRASHNDLLSLWYPAVAEPLCRVSYRKREQGKS